MSYYVKKCAECGAINHPSLTTCWRCSSPLPDSKTESKVAPPNPLANAHHANNQTPIIDDARITPCRIVDIEMPFWSMVNFMVKWAIAAIPAFIILIILGVFAIAVLSAIGVASRP